MIFRDARADHDELPLFIEAEGGSLFGVLTAPERRRSDTLAIFLPAGATVSIDRNSFGVRLCRHLADLGMRSIRFDYHGVGESDGHARRFRLDEPFDTDLLAVVARARREGIERFVLIGSCFGARTAMASADRIPQLEGIALLAAPIRDYEMGDRVATSLAAGRDLSTLARRALGRSPGALRDPAKRRAYLRLAGAGLRGLANKAVHGARERQSEVSPRFLDHVAELVRRSIPTLFVYGNEDELWREFQHARSGPLASADEEGSVDVVTLEGAVHGLKTIRVQDAAIELVTDWVGALPTWAPHTDGRP